MASVLNESHQNALDLLVKAAAYSADCPNGFLIGGAEGDWSLLASYGGEPPVAFDTSIERWLQSNLTNSQPVIIDDALGQSLPVYFHQLRGLGHKFVVGVAIGNEAEEMKGVVFVSSPSPQQRLSTAQFYALQTHAALIGQTLQFQTGLFIPKQKTFMERLRLLESVVVNAKDAILITEAEPIDPPGPRIVYCNPAFLTTTGYTSAEVIGQTPRILQCDDTSRTTLDLIRKALSSWQPIEVELINTRRDGSQFWVELSIVPVANEKGWFTHWVSVQRDISERKKSEHLALQALADREAKVALESRLKERERIEEELSYAAYHDSLTALHNRAYLMAFLLDIFNNSGPRQIPAATVLFLDLDRFKFVNDSLGHGAGDMLLEVVARRLENCISEEHVLARVGGDEFAMLLEGEDQSSRSIELAQRIVDQLNVPIIINGHDIFTSCSIGIVTADATHASPEDLLRDADIAMYVAKKQGRGRWALFDVSMREAAIDALAMQNALKRALANNEFSVVYQPIYSIFTGEVSGVEALVRWRHSVLGRVSPERFIPVAEDIGVMHELGRWVMQTACTELQRWKARFPKLKLHLNVNVSGVELNRSGYVNQIRLILAQTGIEAHDLQVEITESVFLHQPDKIAQILESIRELGVRIALDDFGTGYSALGYIDRYPIDAIKIDQSFVSRMMTFQRSDAIVRSILSLGRALSIDITAEGVENQPQLQRLREMECPFVQGYLLSRPVNAGKIVTLLQLQAT
ncbi:PAS domain S-box-containing protein/diguanylate cyclase (GGDEF)-like protein [Vreelandella songnenensis]|uniref:PAS domain S-box-containing protein/diguanylate cyclase (GGDEF)-like protein n=1 Tax=Vreelandella songnenensis TaxID=1176243 RepID=A0A2T0V6T9_9GAMM|nr:EAL domain-containing protein [Halomonas songnenensis]PRY65827.1 PAS domain S-box-containing protein/diguanylate cyclase (GGDEF)-like protein [Halomonas songnenensis]